MAFTRRNRREILLWQPPSNRGRSKTLKARGLPRAATAVTTISTEQKENVSNKTRYCCACRVLRMCLLRRWRHALFSSTWYSGKWGERRCQNPFRTNGKPHVRTIVEHFDRTDTIGLSTTEDPSKRWNCVFTYVSAPRSHTAYSRLEPPPRVLR